MRQISGLLLLVALVGCGRTPISSVELSKVESIEVRFEPWRGEKQPTPVRSTDKEAIRAFLESVQPAEETSEHKCASRMLVVLAQQSGKKLELRLLPGHNVDYYEYRCGDKIYRVSRNRLVAALKKLGIEQVPLQAGMER